MAESAVAVVSVDLARSIADSGGDNGLGAARLLAQSGHLTGGRLLARGMSAVARGSHQLENGLLKGEPK